MERQQQKQKPRTEFFLLRVSSPTRVLAPSSCNKKLSSLGLVTRAERQCYPRLVDLGAPPAGIEDRTPLAVTARQLPLWGQGVKLLTFDCWLSDAYGHDSASARASSQSQCNDPRRLLPAPRPPMRPRRAVQRQRH